MERIMNELIGEMIMELGFEMHCLVRTGQLTREALFNFPPLVDRIDEIPYAFDIPRGSRLVNPSSIIASSSTSSTSIKASGQLGTSRIVTCPICSETVSGQRFAPHLEKCMKGGKRGSRKNVSSGNSGLSLSLPYHNPKGKSQTLVDPYPQSPVVRIKLKNGVPRGNTIRMGVSIENFAAAKANELVKELALQS